jgi:hypothetical protein
MKTEWAPVKEKRKAKEVSNCAEHVKNVKNNISGFPA